MRIDRRLVALGLFLVTAGAVMLAVRQGLLSDTVAARAWTLWPLLLVGAGLSIVLAGRPGASLGGLVVAVTLGAMLGGFGAGGFGGGFGVCTSGGDPGPAFPEEAGAITPGATVSLAISCGQLDVSTQAGTGWSLSGSSADGNPPSVSTDAGGLGVETRDRGPFAFEGGRNRWAVVVPTDPGFDLEVTTNGGSTRLVLEGAALRDTTVTTNAGSATIDLRGITAIADLSIETNAGSTTIRLPDRSVSGSVDVNAGSAALCTTAGVGLRIELDGVISSNDLSTHGLIRTGDAWETPGFSAAATRIDLQVDVNAGSLSLDPARECAA